MKSDKGLVVIATPKQLKDFIWYCVAEDEKNRDWDVIIQTRTEGLQYFLEDACKKLPFIKSVGIVGRFDKGNLKNKISIIIKMLLGAIFNRKEQWARSVLREYSNNEDYAKAVVPCEYGVLTGAIINLAKVFNVDVLEDGAADYYKKTKKFSFKYLLYPKRFIGYLAAVMGFFDPYAMCGVDGLENCRKFAEYPDKLFYKNYKEVLPLNVELYDEKQNEEYRTLIEKVFGLEYDNNRDSVIIFTTPLKEAFSDASKYQGIIEKYIRENYKGKTVVLKRHPRDDTDYDFGGVEIKEISQYIPAELLLGQMRFHKAIFLWQSTAMSSVIRQTDEVELLIYTDMFGGYTANGISYDADLDSTMSCLDSDIIEKISKVEL